MTVTYFILGKLVRRVSMRRIPHFDHPKMMRLQAAPVEEKLIDPDCIEAEADAAIPEDFSAEKELPIEEEIKEILPQSDPDCDPKSIEEEKVEEILDLITPVENEKPIVVHEKPIVHEKPNVIHKKPVVVHKKPVMVHKKPVVAHTPVRHQKKPIRPVVSAQVESDASKSASKGSTYFPVSFGNSAGDTVALANSFSTGKSGNAHSMASSFGSKAKKH